MQNNVCDILRKRIVSLYYKPGQPLNEKKLAEELGVSRTPIREALTRLATENLVTIVRHSGARVSDINLRDFQELIELRLILEKGCARLAAQRATEKEIRALERLHEKVKSLGEDNIPELMECDTKFHEIIRQAAHNRFLAEALAVVVNQFTRIQRMIANKPEKFRSDLPRVIKALKERDVDLMEYLVVSHVEHFVNRVRSYFKVVH